MEQKNAMKWTQALNLLFEACRPLTFDCILTKEEIAVRDENVYNHVLYCEHVKVAIEDGVEPLSFDEWSDRAKRFDVSAQVRLVKITHDDLQQFADDLTRMFE
jgi:hypothetical protein